MSAMSPETAAPISPSDIQYSEPMQNLRAPVAPAASAAPVPPMAPTVPVAPAATAQPSASFTPEQIAASRQAFYESQSKKSSSSAQPGKMTQSTIDALVNLNPAVIKAQIEYDELEANIGILGDRIKGAVEFSADTPKLKTELETLLKGLPAAKNKLALIKSSAEVQLSGLENPQEIMDFYKVQEAVAQDRLKRAETEAAAKAAAAGAPAAGAGTTTETPKPPAPPVGSDPLEQVAIDRELKRKAGPEPVSPEINKKWTENKQKIIDVIPPKELMRIADEVYGDSVIGVSLPADKTRLTKLIQVRLSDNQKISGDGKNLGFYQDGKYVSQDDLVAALVDDIIRARQSGTAKANDSAIAPQSRIPLNTNTELIAQ
jgi:hypothetical protein